MNIVRVRFHDWNGNDRSVDVTSDMYPSLVFCTTDERLIIAGVHYIKRRYVECMDIISVEIIAC